ncbi:MAG: DNA replication/repair protein RecF [Solirubrobacterales bacterium]|nr:DNA replication/repair protein RecF [Solirubrobacterales bacterium]
MRVGGVEPCGFRNLADSATELSDGITVFHGPNGAGKTNLLEAIYFGLVAHSCRGGRAGDMIRHGEDSGRVELNLEGAPGRVLLSSLDRGGERRHLLDGRPLSSALERPLVSVFLPERLQLVKGPPAHRRAHLDRLIAALWPARGDLHQRFGRALAQRNALVARVRGGHASSASLGAWDEELARAAEPLVKAREQAVEMLRAPFAGLAERLGVGSAEISYRSRVAADASAFAAELAERRTGDLGRGYTGHGPQLDEVALEREGRSLRRFGSQGQQRAALLALLLAERQALIDLGRPPPLMLLDDVMSELDAERRGLLCAALSDSGQALLTATDADQVPVRERAIAVANGRSTTLAVAA